MDLTLKLLWSTRPKDVLVKVALDFLVVTMVFGLLWLCAPRRFSPKIRASWALKALSIVHAIVVAGPSIWALFAEDGMKDITIGVLEFNIEAVQYPLLHANSHVAAACIPLTLAYFIFDLLLVPVWEGTLRQHIPVFAHHGLSLLTWPVGLCHPACHWFLLCCLTMEFSTPFVQLRWFISTHWGKDNIFYIANGLLMMAAFFACRIYPMMPHNIWAIFISEPHSSKHSATLPPHVRASASILILPNLLNLFWFYLMCQGLILLVLGKKNKKKTTTTRDADSQLNKKVDNAEVLGKKEHLKAA